MFRWDTFNTSRLVTIFPIISPILVKDDLLCWDLKFSTENRNTLALVVNLGKSIFVILPQKARNYSGSI
ncbi:hypothetical protein HI914_05639 [Erysiphe necator]|nr:hypothetical protein HI914_05639 [Erysiphe necator]